VECDVEKGAKGLQAVRVRRAYLTDNFGLASDIILVDKMY